VGALSQDVFSVLPSTGRGRLRGLLVSIAVHTVVIAAVWQSRAFENAFHVQVVHASGIEKVRFVRVNSASPRFITDQKRSATQAFNALPIHVASHVASMEEQQPSLGTEAIAADVSASLKLASTSDVSEDTLQRHVLRTQRLEMESPEALLPQLGGNVEPARLLTRSIPIYPALAKTARIQGIVVLEAAISETGELENITVVSGHPLLIDSAVEAVRQWRYEPAKLDGSPTRSSVRISVNFKLEFR
jgi:TonB family protein